MRASIIPTYLPAGMWLPRIMTNRVWLFKILYLWILTTCGLSNIGVPTEDESGKTGLHGTISHIPADHIYYTEDDDKIVLHAAISDGEIFKQKLVLHRGIGMQQEGKQAANQ